MKNKIFILLIACFVIFGCGKKEEENTNRMENYDINSWKIDLSTKSTSSDEEVKNVLINATKDVKDKEYEYVSLLGTQVVAGTNYIYLTKCTIDNDTKWYIVRIYEDLEGKCEITYEKEFDLSNYTYEKEYEYNEEESNMNSVIVGGWNINSNIETSIDENITRLFNDATKDLESVTYKPVALIATQKTQGTHYAILSLGTLNENSILSLISFYIDENNNSYINSIYNIDLANFNE